MEFIVKNRIPLYMTFAVIIGFAIIIGMNAMNLMKGTPAIFISPSEVRGMAIEHKGTLFTLNFDQQNALVEMFNRATPISPDAAKLRSVSPSKTPDIQKIIIYRFNQSDIEIKPEGYIKSEGAQLSTDSPIFIFSAPAWNTREFLQESSQDNIRELLLKTYDH